MGIKIEAALVKIGASKKQKAKSKKRKCERRKRKGKRQKAKGERFFMRELLTIISGNVTDVNVTNIWIWYYMVSGVRLVSFQKVD